MPDLVEQMYCSQQIQIPPTFPYILKKYCKAAIRTQPYDLLRWSAAYFRCLACGEAPPVKERLEFPPTDYPTGLTPGYLRVLLKQFEGRDFVTAEEIWLRWRGICLEEEPLKEIFMLGAFETEVEVLKFIAICAGYLSVRLSRTMILICEILTEEPEGGSSMIPYDTFIMLYVFLAQMNCGPVEDWENIPMPPDEIEGAESARDSVDLSEHSCERDVTPEPSVKEEKRELEPSDSVAELKCESELSVIELEDFEKEMKDAIWSAFIEKLPEMGSEVAPDLYETLKEDLWNSVSEKLPHDSETGSISSLLEGVLQAIPLPTETKKAKKSAVYEDPILNLKNAIWDAIKDKIPDVTKPEYMAKMREGIPYRSNEAEIRDLMWESVLERVPSLKRIVEISQPDQWPYGYKGMVPPKHPPGYVHPRICPPPPRVPGYTCPKLEEVQPAWLGTCVPAYRVHVKGIGPVIPQEQIDAVIEYLKEWADCQEGMVMPRNIRHFLCPPLDLEGTDELKDAAPPEQDRRISVEEAPEEEAKEEEVEEEDEEFEEDEALEELPLCRSPASSID